jgi:heterodisulfide reductase subunit A
LKTACVVGAGVTGITVANNLSKAGVGVCLVERNPYPGGQAVFYGCKAAEHCVHCGVCLVRDAMATFRRDASIRKFFSSLPKALAPKPDGSFELQLQTSPNPIDWQACTECGNCQKACPEDAIQRVPGWKYYIDGRCNACGKCVEACPVGAIELRREPQRSSLSVQSIVLATGFQPFDPAINRKWGYGSSPRVITGSDLEKLFGQEKFLPDGAGSLAFIQCVGSRNTMEGEKYCSRVCCAYALRMANRIKKENPDVSIDFFYMDIQHFGKNFDQFWGEVKGRINLIQSNPILIKLDEQGRPIVRFESIPDLRCQEKPYDLVVLSNGLCPSQDREHLAEMFSLDLVDNGFLSEPGSRAGRSLGAGVFPAGTSTRPMRIDECVEDASRVTNRVLRYIGEKI